VLEAHDTPGHPLAPWFEYKRRLRREHYAARERRRGAPRRSAILTIVQNEPVFFPIWLRYYSRFFEPEHIYVLDHESTDGSTAGNGFVRVPVSHDTFDNRWMVATIEDHQRRLLERYDVVVVVDVDEIIAPEPTWGTLGDYLARFDEEWVNCLGYEVVHIKDEEPPLRPDRPVLEQRRYWYPNDAYDKPSIATVPLRWKPGFHARADYHFNFDPDLRLIHLHRVDYELCLSRHRKWRARTWNPRDLEAGWGVHNRITDDADFERWFYEDSAVDGVPIRLEEIPAPWRRVV
jgi:Glycosyl transferase family 2